MHGPIIVVSDIHLGAAPAAVERAFIEFLRDWPAEAKGLLINGDLFDFWFEYRSVVPGTHFHVLRALADLSERGIRLQLVGGNHDAWGGRFLETEIGLELLDGPVELDLCGRRTLVAHGDGLGSGDLGYKALRRLLRSRPSRGLMRLIHPDLAHRIAAGVSRTGQRTERDRERARQRSQILRDHALELMRERPDLDLVLFGHCHIPEVREVEPGRHYVNSGDWVEHRTMTVIDRERIEQRDWPVAGSSPGFSAIS